MQYIYIHECLIVNDSNVSYTIIITMNRTRIISFNFVCSNTDNRSSKHTPLFIFSPSLDTLSWPRISHEN